MRRRRSLTGSDTPTVRRNDILELKALAIECCIQQSTYHPSLRIPWRSERVCFELSSPLCLSAQLPP